jgi:REP element-mobilizing transposase RayT
MDGIFALSLYFQTCKIVFIQNINSLKNPFHSRNMVDKYQNKYRIPSARAQWWNYADCAGYFITICTKNRAHYFGEIVMNVVETRCIASLKAPTPNQPIALLQSTDIGQIVKSEWLKTPSIRPDMNLDLDEFVVMPNHFHAIIWIGDNQYNSENAGRDAMHGVSTTTLPPQDRVCDMDAETPCMASLPVQLAEWWCELHAPSTNKFGPQYKNLASILRGFRPALRHHFTRIIFFEAVKPEVDSWYK